MGDAMSIEFALIGIIVCSILYLLIFLFQNKIELMIQTVKKELFKSQIIEEKEEHKINAYYSFILLFISIFYIGIFLVRKYWVSNIMMRSQSLFILNIGFVILGFLLGLLCSKFKKLLYFFCNHYTYVIQTLLLTSNLLFFIPIQEQCISSITIILSLFNCICMLLYFHCFSKKMYGMKSLEFLFQFFWILLLQFLNSFIFIYHLCHR